MSQIQPAGMKSRSKAENRAGYDGGEESEKQNGPVNGYGIETRHAIGHQTQEKPPGEEKDGQAGDSAEQRKKHALGQHLRCKAFPAGSESLAKSHFASSCTG